jgi:hypothetical protein
LNAQAKEDLEDTKKSLSADEEFLMMLKEKCSMTDSEWEERQKTRQLEMEACSKALAVLSSDDAHDLFTKTFNPSLVQTEASMHSERRTQASKLLSAVAKKLQNPRLAILTRVNASNRTRTAKVARRGFWSFLATADKSFEAKALAVLSSDDAHDLFTKTFTPGLVQTETSTHSERRAQASKLLSAVAKKLQNPRLATLAVRVRLDAFTRVKIARRGFWSFLATADKSFEA